MISRRELLRRLGLSSIAVAAAPLAARIDTLPTVKKAANKSAPLKVGPSQLSINGQIVGQIVRLEHETQRATIDVTNLDSVRRDYIGIDTVRITVTTIGNGFIHIQDVFTSGDVTEIILCVDGYNFSFDGIIESSRVFVSSGEPMQHETTMLITGSVHVT